MTMRVSLIIAILCSLLLCSAGAGAQQTPAMPPVPPVVPGEKTPSTPAEKKGVTPPEAPSLEECRAAFDALQASSQTLLERQAKNFVVNVKGEYWDRQVWLMRQKLREQLKKTAAVRKDRTDIERAHGASAKASLDPESKEDGIKQEYRGQGHGLRGYGKDSLDPPLFWSVGDKIATTEDEIDQARACPFMPFDKDYRRNVCPLREISPQELAWAIRNGKAELSKFSWTKQIIKKAVRGGRDDSNIITPEEARYSWRREAVKVYAKAEPLAPELPDGHNGEGAEPPKKPQ